jgi:hypothetical protein
MPKRPGVSKKRKLAEEEIMSDEAEGSSALEDDFFEAEETPEERRIRLAKSLIHDIEAHAPAEEVNALLSQTGV